MWLWFHFLHLYVMAFTVFHNTSDVLEKLLYTSPCWYLLTSDIPYKLCKHFVDHGFSRQMKPIRCKESLTETASLYLVLIRINYFMTAVQSLLLNTRLNVHASWTRFWTRPHPQLLKKSQECSIIMQPGNFSPHKLCLIVFHLIFILYIFILRVENILILFIIVKFLTS